MFSDLFQSHPIAPPKLHSVMLKLIHFPLCPYSRSIRLILAEYDFPVEFSEQRAWEYRPEFLAINPAGELPVLQVSGGVMLCGTYAISEFIAEEVTAHPVDNVSLVLFPGDREDRADVRRLVDWFHGKFDREVTQQMLSQKIIPRLTPALAKAPDTDVLRAVRKNLRYHLSYVGYLAEQRGWLAGDDMSFADLAGAAHFSVLDYLAEVMWDEHPAAKEWYQRVKSRRSFRTLLADRLPGIAPPAHYANLDF